MIISIMLVAFLAAVPAALLRLVSRIGARRLNQRVSDLTAKLDQHGRRLEELTDGLKTLEAAQAASQAALQERVVSEVRTLASRCERVVSDGISQVSSGLAEQSRGIDQMKVLFAGLKALVEANRAAAELA